MERDERLEAISDKIRHGIPVGFIEAIEAIDYQEAWKKHRDANTWWQRTKRRIKEIAAAPKLAGEE